MSLAISIIWARDTAITGPLRSGRKAHPLAPLLARLREVLEPLTGRWQGRLPGRDCHTTNMPKLVTEGNCVLLSRFIRLRFCSSYCIRLYLESTLGQSKIHSVGIRVCQWHRCRNDILVPESCRIQGGPALTQ